MDYEYHGQSSAEKALSAENVGVDTDMVTSGMNAKVKAGGLVGVLQS